jgi:hypothetical protein
VILRHVPRQTLEALRTREEQLAFWINAYNALVAEGIVTRGTLRMGQSAERWSKQA